MDLLLERTVDKHSETPEKHVNIGMVYNSFTSK